MPRILPLLPALLLALFAGWCGTFAGGATVTGSAGGIAALLVLLLAAGSSWRDPLRLGGFAWLVPALWLVAAASTFLSPVPRAGRSVVLLLPAFLWLPAAVSACWQDEAARRLGSRWLAVVVAGVATWGLCDQAGWMGGGSLERAAMPLGHHVYLAAWLVTLLPLALLAVREPGLWRWVGLAAGALAAGGIFASRSFTGLLALCLEVFLGGALLALDMRRRKGSTGKRLRIEAGGPREVAAGEVSQDGRLADDISSRRSLWPGRGPRPVSAGSRRGGKVTVLVVATVGAACVLAPRASEILAGRDPSFRARAVYLRAGWDGFLARPVLGWGAGAAAWTAGAFLHPIPGVNPWGEAVGELHSLPVQLAYELGSAGCLVVLAVVLCFALGRMREWRSASSPADAVDRGLMAASLLGLAGAAIASAGTAALAVTALPLAAATVAGAALASAPAIAARRAHPVKARLPAAVYAAVATFGLAPCEMARCHYERAAAAMAAGGAGLAREELAQAVALDPGFPLYRMRLALLASGGREPRERGVAAALALGAARDGYAVASSWLVAGVTGYAAELPWARRALERTCRLDPLDPFPPFYLMAADPRDPSAPLRGARSLLADPRLAAATFWEGREELFGRTLAAVRSWPRVDAGWKESFLGALPRAAERVGPRVRLQLELDTAPSRSLSLFVFRRRAWPTEWALIDLRLGPLQRITVPPATTLEKGAPDLSRAEGCSAPEMADLPRAARALASPRGTARFCIGRRAAAPRAARLGLGIGDAVEDSRRSPSPVAALRRLAWRSE